MDFAFISAKLEEAAQLSELRKKVWETTYRGIYPDEMIDSFDYSFHNERNRMYIQTDHFLVSFLVKDTEKIGYLILKKQNPLQIQSLYLLPEYRRQGIGTSVFQWVRCYCRVHGIAAFQLDCHPDNTGALAFYSKMGGIVTHRDEGHERNEENGVTVTFSV